ncbi:MAG: hypothetical protein NC132_04300 [Corallococcus sp.]|nr:hypothetical protein [Corallococcus sp.]MCM1359881.1 hypothetical protein [Corallococcus sp.]MCM1395315.1 hypothetical protein [Corallococcus sp.]
MTENTNTVNANKKATVLQAVKAVAVLVAICLICCLLLALCNDLLYISDEEKFNRKLAKIYPGTFTVDTKFNQTPVSEFAKESNYGNIVKVYKSTEGDYILQSKGIGGYNGGSVTLYVAVSAADSTIVGWGIESNEGQTFIANITDKYQKAWYIGSRVDGDLSLGNNKVSGTTMSSTAVNNAINMAAYYCMNALGIGSNPVADAMQAVIDLLVTTDESYADYSLENASGIFAGEYEGKTVESMLSDSSNAITYYLRGTGANGDVQAFVYGSDENRKIVALTANGMIHSENVEGTEDFVTNIITNKVYASGLPSNLTRYALITNIDTSDATKTVYTVVGLKVGSMQPKNYVLTIEITENGGAGEITAAAIATDGFVPGQPTQDNANKMVTALVGATTATFDVWYAAGKVGGATQSADLIAIAAKAALADFDASLAKA